MIRRPDVRAILRLWLAVLVLLPATAINPQTLLHDDGFEGAGGGAGDSGLLNPGLSGTLLLEAPGSFSGRPFSPGAVVELLLRMDIGTGHYQRVPYSRWREQFPESDDHDFTAIPQDYRRGRIALTVQDCRRIGDQCVAIVGEDGRYVSRIKMVERVVEPARLSPDGRYFVVVESLVGAGYDMGIYRNDGKLISYGQEVHVLAQPRWLPDNRLLYRNDSFRSFVYSTPLSVKAKTQRTLPASVTGTIRSFSISPDSQTVAFILQRSDNRSDRELLTMGLNTGNLRRVAKQESANHYMFSPTWSPDGKYILLQLISGPPAPPLGPARSPWLFAVPPGGKNVLTVGPEGASSPGIIQLRRFRLFRNNDEELDIREIVDYFTGQPFMSWQP